MGIDVKFSGSNNTFPVKSKANVLIKGEDGATFVPEISEDGLLSWTNDKNLNNPTPISIKGPRGDKGDPGEPGKDGKSPIKGVDYWTDADKSEISEYVDKELSQELSKKLDKKDAVGEKTEANGEIFGDYEYNKATNTYGHAEGSHTEAGWRSHAEGYLTLANNTSHAEGRLSQATGKGSHAEGIEISTDIAVVSEQDFSIDDVEIEVTSTLKLNVGDYIAIKPEGYNSSDCKRIVEIRGTTPIIPGFGAMSIVIDSPLRAENYYEGLTNSDGNIVCPEDGIIPAGATIKKAKMTKALGDGSHAEGYGTVAGGNASHTEGIETQAKNGASHAEGYQTVAEGDNTGCAHAEGHKTHAKGAAAHSEGKDTIAEGDYSHSEGYDTKAQGENSHAEGWLSKATAKCSHSEGYDSLASGHSAHAEGYSSDATNDAAHAEGFDTLASGHSSHAEGRDTKATAAQAHAEGRGTIASGDTQHVQGQFNIIDDAINGNSITLNKKGKYAHIIGNGSSINDRSNAHTLDWNGNAWFAGYIESTALILKSPNGSRFKITVGDDGVLSTAKLD